MGTARALDGLLPLRFSPMDTEAARAIFTWRYEAPYDVYNLDVDDEEQVVSCFVDPANAYHAIADNGGALVAYCCFGLEARVPGGDYGLSALDVGLGVRPDLTGQGLGRAFADAVLRFAGKEIECTGFRVTVAEFNERALCVWKGLRFEIVQRFERTFDGMPFLILARQRAVAPDNATLI